MTSPMYAELEGDRIHIYMRGFFPAYVKLLDSGALQGANFRKTPKPHWTISPDIDLAKKMRALFGEDLELGPNLKKWAKKKMRTNDRLTGLALSDTANLTRLPEVLPELYRAIHVGPRGKALLDPRSKMYDPAEFDRIVAEDEPSYQAADVLYMATAEHPVNTNQPGTGKTLETIAAIYEESREYGPKLVVAPVSSHEVVWRAELEHWQDQPVYVCPNGSTARQRWMKEMAQRAADDEDFWVVLNWQMIQYRHAVVMCEKHQQELPKPKRADLESCPDCNTYLSAAHGEVFDIGWTVVIMDEFHDMGLGNPATLTYQALNDITSEKRIPLSGTPMAGKPLKMFGLLHFLFPKEFSSKWRFIDTWLVKEEDWSSGTKRTKVGDIRPGLEDAFYEMLSRHMIRRTKAEVLPWLPDKQYIPDEDGWWVDMDGKQKEQYLEFAEMAEIRIEEELLSATSILAEYTRLKQFAMAEQIIQGWTEEGKPILAPTTNSCKLPVIYDILKSLGIRPGEFSGDEQVLIFSQFTTVVDMVCDELQRLGYPAERFHGDTTKANRARLIRAFQDEEDPLRVLVVNLKAGGSSITLDAASTAIFMDETWNPDDHEQAEDRIHRGSKIHQVQVHYIRTRGTIEEAIQERVLDKSAINKDILDLRRMGLKAIWNQR